MNNLIRPPATRKDRGITQDLWGLSPHEGAMCDPFWGSTFFDDFTGGVATGLYTKSNLNSGSATFTAVAGRHGIARLDVGSTTNNHGGQVQYGAGSLLGESGNTVFWETLVKFNAATTQPKAFIGLAESDTALLGATGAIDVDDCIGFVFAGGDNNIDWIVRLDGTSNIASETIGTYTNGAWLHLGIRIEDGKRFVPFLNALQLDEYIVTNSAYNPAVALCPSWALCGSGTTQPTLDVDYHKGCDSERDNVRT